MTPIKAIVYGAGMVNRIATRLMTERGIRVVGAINRPGPKIGRDIGALAGLDRPLGISVSDDAEAVLATPADIVVVAVCDDMERGFPIYRRCLEHGLNVATVGTFLSFPWRQAPEAAAALDRLARERGITLVGTGNQDFFMVNLGLLMSGVCHRIERITQRNFSDVSPYGRAVADQVGVGQPVDAFDVETANDRPSIYTPFLETVADGLELRVRDIRQTTTPVVAERAIFYAGLDRAVEPGEIIGLTQRLDVATETGPALVGENTLRLFYEDEEEYKEWLLEGEPDLHVRATRLDTALTTASQTVNRIPDIIAAEPGLLTVTALPPLTYRPGACSA